MIKLDLLFKNVTKYSKKVYDTFSRFHKKNFAFRYHLYTFMTSAFFLLLIASVIKTLNYPLIILLCVCLVVFLLWRFFRPIEESRKYYQDDKTVKESTYTFFFYDNCFKVSNKKYYSVFKYRELYRIYETKYFFYLYTDRVHALLLDKANFKKGTSIDFKNFLKKKCPFKYRTPKYRKKNLH